MIGRENLNVSGILANGKLAKAIADMGFYEFRRLLAFLYRSSGTNRSSGTKT
ncbi:hypothetical protein FJR41_004515 [Dolichospermum planctonicum UHCC 0167]|uniref:hypothetical protein n=1 Tax=Dolichospermum planctonicum TaxID=136072 RepID=UPI00224551A4|nr:hypothetical protein [Dolichospermum planctonicum]MCW9680080.1 hypothetical protein [Dolichospermum planctonicum UHCC 0167]